MWDLYSNGTSEARAAFHVLSALIHAIAVVGHKANLWPRPAFLDGFPVPPPPTELNGPEEEAGQHQEQQQQTQPQAQAQQQQPEVEVVQVVAPNLAIGAPQPQLAANAIMPPPVVAPINGHTPVPIFQAAWGSQVPRDEIIISSGSHAPGARYTLANDLNHVQVFFFSEITPMLIRMEYSALK